MFQPLDKKGPSSNQQPPPGWNVCNNMYTPQCLSWYVPIYIKYAIRNGRAKTFCNTTLSRAWYKNWALHCESKQGFFWQWSSTNTFRWLQFKLSANASLYCISSKRNFYFRQLSINAFQIIKCSFKHFSKDRHTLIT